MKRKPKLSATDIQPSPKKAAKLPAKARTVKRKVAAAKKRVAKETLVKKTVSKKKTVKKATSPKAVAKKKAIPKSKGKSKPRKKSKKKASSAVKVPSLSAADRKALMVLKSGIYHSDCVTGMQQVPEGSVDLVFADPPFNIGYNYDVYEDKLAADEYLKWSEQWISEAYRVLKADGSFWLAIGDDFAAELKLMAQRAGFHCRSWVIWYYTFGVNCKFKFTRSHTHLLYFVKDVEAFTFNSEDLENRIPSARMLVYNDSRTNPKGRLPDDTWIIPPDVQATFALRPQDMQECFLPNESDWYFPRVAGTFKERAGFHGCQMPEQLLARIIRSCSHEGEVVLDPFSGSASSMLVAKKLHRKHISFELSDEYADAGRERLDAVQAGDDLEGSAEPKMSALPTWKKAQQAGGKTAVGRQTRFQQLNAVTIDAADVQSLIEALDLSLPDDASLADQVQVAVQRAALRAFAAIADRYSIGNLEKGGKALRSFHKHCRELGIPGDADAHFDCLKLALQSHGQLF